LDAGCIRAFPPAAARKELSFSSGFAALPQNQTNCYRTYAAATAITFFTVARAEKNVSSLLPQPALSAVEWGETRPLQREQPRRLRTS
jgi:hypothetical protein